MTATLYKAKKIITMCTSRPFADHVLVRDGKILGVGSAEELSGWGSSRLDDRFADKVMMPGLVEGHAHALEGACWRYIYAGRFARTSPDGTRIDGCDSIAAAVNRLREQAAPGNQAIVGWGFDPIYFPGRRMIATDLDQVADDRPVLVLHASAHMVNVNSFVLEQAGITADTSIHGVIRDENGRPTGELRELAAMFVAFEICALNPFDEMASAEAAWEFAHVARRQGVTTLTDLYSSLSDTYVEAYNTATKEEHFPARIFPAYAALSAPVDEGIERVQSLIPESTPKLQFGLVKMMTDGSIQGFTARLKWPGYFNGAENGIWNAPPEELKSQLKAYHKAGLQLHIHTNGDEASELMLDAIEEAQCEHPRFDHRHTLQHCQMANEAQLRRAASLGVAVNMFANHLYYWGDQHAGITIGPDRAGRLEPFATADRLGVPYAMHSDAPVTPIAPLFTAWCAVNRQTASGRILGEHERISVDKALRAITLGAAYTLKADDQIGSIEVGKFADFAILDDDPLVVPPEELKDIGVHATVVGGRVVDD